MLLAIVADFDLGEALLLLFGFGCKYQIPFVQPPCERTILRFNFATDLNGCLIAMSEKF